VPVGTPGALSTLVEAGPLPGSSITYAYDALGRVSTRTVAGSGAETVQYDAIGRVTGKTNDMGAFTLSYLGQTGQITQRQLASSTLSTAWTYLNNAGDRRLASIANVGLVSGHFSTYTYTTAPEDILSSITESSDAATVYPTQAQQTAGYNTLNQLTSLQGQAALTYNANGNLVSDEQRTYTWDAEDRLIGIGYPGQPGKQTAFAYDGLGRRVAISSTPPGGGSATTTSYVWCDSDICQSRDASNAVTRGYHDEGEFVVGTSQPLYPTFPG
jgi:YD repeat-containing protein